jgi:hypothetical protein
VKTEKKEEKKEEIKMEKKEDKKEQTTQALASTEPAPPQPAQSGQDVPS